ncbi:MAG: hypothetical protein ACRDRC_09755, partial [Pseudonocardiaceae bacterium]
MLELIATDEQKQRYLRPLAAGDVRFCFALTEPAPGAGSDPAALTIAGRFARRAGERAGAGVHSLQQLPARPPMTTFS